MITTNDGIIASLTYKSLKASPIKPTETFQNKLQKMDNKLRKEVRDWLGSTTKNKFKATESNFSSSEELVDLTPDETLKLFEGWGDMAGELNLEYTTKLGELKNLVPVNSSVTLFGVDDRPPSSYEQKKWLLALDVFKDPFLVIDKMNSGVLLGDEIEKLGLFYPSILETLQQFIVEGLSELKGKGVDKLNRDKMAIINTILQVPRLSPAKLEALQAEFSEKEGTNINTDTNSIQTETQRISLK